MRDAAKGLARGRLARIEGQVRGLLGMIEDGRDCVEILTQVASVRTALEGLGWLILTEHVEEILAAGSGWQDAEARERGSRIREALALFIR